MITTDFETRQLLAREHRDQLARDMRLARRTRPQRTSLLAARRVFRRAHDSIRSLPGLKPSQIRLSQEVTK
jgi:hypothetical protein